MPIAALSPIDCDVHPTVPALDALLPYLDDVWRDNAIRRGMEELVTISYPTINPLTFRADWRDASGKAGTTPAALGGPGAGAVRHAARDLQLPVRCPGDVQRGPRRRRSAAR